VKINILIRLINHKIYKRFLYSIFTACFLVCIFENLAAQKPYYFHTIHSHGLSLTAGRTVKLNYMHQLTHVRQFKLSGAYIYDSYSQDRNKIKAQIYNMNFQFQYQVIYNKNFFLNMALGFGGYHLYSKDLLNIKHSEWSVNFVTGVQAEFYIKKNDLALTLDYDIFYMPWGKIYEILHVPTVGLTFFLF